MTAFSRLQLAAALLEYDNDPDNPEVSRSAKDSAIFSHIRTRNAPRARTISGFEHLHKSSNLDVPRTEVNTGSSVDARRSLAGTRNSRGSIDVLRNPFGGGDDILESERGDEELAEEDLEVDLEAWGMAGFLGKDKEKEKQRSKNQRSGPRTRQASTAQSELLPNSHNSVAIDEFGQLDVPRHHHPGSRSKSMGGLGAAEELFEARRGNAIASESDFRRRSIGAPLDPTGRITPDFDRPLSMAGLPESLPDRPQSRGQQLGPTLHNIPFPSSSPTPEETEDAPNSFAIPLTSTTSRFDPKLAAHTRAMSNSSLGSRIMLEPGVERPPTVLDENPFALRPSSRSSRFDPKVAAQARPMSRASLGAPSLLDTNPRERTLSNATMGTQSYLDDNPFSLPPPSPTRTSRFDPKAAAHARTMSTASLGSRLTPDVDRMSVISGQLLHQDGRPSRPYSRMELMRPKVLVMPSPLQDSEPVPADPQLPAGFQLSTMGPPLPPGATPASRPGARLSSIGNLQVPTVAQAFTPNPRLSMSLSQLTFRNSLMSGGQRDVAYDDIERGLRRAQEDGEQIYQEEDIEEEVAEEQKQAQGRAAGKLYGRSLMDELQARKDKMRSKQRVFTGDQRPSMMSRGQIRRSSTLIDPATLQDRPVSQNFAARPQLTRRGSSGSKPLLDFSGETMPTSPTNDKITNSKSVFGVDQLWERELAKLKEIEAVEKAEEEERLRREEEKAAKKSKKKGKDKSSVQPPSPASADAIPRPSTISDLPPTLPAIEKATTRRPRPPVLPEIESDSDSEASEIEAKAKAATQSRQGADGWGSSDDEDDRKAPRKAGSDSEDDVPLARQLQLPTVRAPSPDSEDEKPLSKVLERKSLMPDVNFDSLLGNSRSEQKPASAGDEEEDDTPLAVRHPRAQSMVLANSAAPQDEDDDDKPLGLKQAQQQQQQAQYNVMAQQQMMMEAQLRNTLAFGAPSMMSGFSPFLMTPPTFSSGTPGTMHDPAKYQSVDRWRHNIASD